MQNGNFKNLIKSTSTQNDSIINFLIALHDSKNLKIESACNVLYYLFAKAWIRTSYSVKFLMCFNVSKLVDCGSI